VKAVTPLERFRREVLAGYGRWLTDLHGFSQPTLAKNRYSARVFLDWLGERAKAAALRKLTVEDVDAFFVWRNQHLRRATRAGVAHCLRSFLRYLHAAELIDRDLASAVTSPKLYQFESIPAALTDAHIKALLAATRQDRTKAGRRDYAILLLLATYGLRAGEVIRLRLEDIDWRREQFRVRHSKRGGEAFLPLTDQVGNALLGYLRHGRPATAHREVFLYSRAPYRPFARSSSLGTMINQRLHRLGIQPPEGRHGAHAFRHARAVGLLRAQVPLKTIGDLLGHRSASSTAVYLKLATDDLRDVGLGLPQEVAP
jgi:site-specific recombinase XerD